MARQRQITACDCETDPFLHGRNPMPFIWGFYDGKTFITFDTTEEFVAHVRHKNIIIYAHNGGKFDFIYLLPFVGETKAQIINGRVVSMKLGEAELIDSYAAVPESLKKIKKLDIEYWKLEKEHRHVYRNEIITYLRGDCVYLHELMVAYRNAAGTKKTIASNALAHAKRIGINPGTTNNRFDTNYRPFYFGGRTECFQPGIHKNISVFDIKSSYPDAMMKYHPTGANFTRQSELGDLNADEIERAFIILDCESKGAFPLRTIGAQGLHFPHKRDVFHVTGWEYLTAKKYNLISNEQIIEVRYSKEKITFKEYVEHWYKYKNDHPKKTDPINYTIGKIMMNSLYGKMAQNPARYYDYKICEPETPLPCNSPHEKADTGKCGICGFAIMDHGWTRYTKFEGKEFHRRESLWKYKFRFGVEWEAKPLYKNVATGASITGYARAHLLSAIHEVGPEHVIYCDTDSLVLKPEANFSVLPQSNNIGDWEHEIENASEGIFCGKKLYGIDLDSKKKCHCVDPSKSCERHKVVSKGARLTYKDLQNMQKGETITYKSDAPSFSLANGTGFIVRNIRQTAQ